MRYPIDFFKSRSEQRMIEHGKAPKRATVSRHRIALEDDESGWDVTLLASVSSIALAVLLGIVGALGFTMAVASVLK